MPPNEQTVPFPLPRTPRPMRRDNMQRQLERLRRELTTLIGVAPGDPFRAHEADVMVRMTLRAIAALWSDPTG